MTDVRALAAEVLADVALRGASLRERSEPALPRLADPRDRAFLTALVHEGARWWLRFDAALARLLQRPLRHEPAVQALLVLGLVQLEILKVPPHAAVGATVDAARALGRGGLAKLVNAILRRWLRERAALAAELDRDPVTRTAHPRWLVDAIATDWPDAAEAVLAAGNVAAPPMLRVNARRGARPAAQAALERAGIKAAPHAWLPDALALGEHADVAHLPGFAEGRISAQDGAAQCAADLLDLHDGQRVLDACAAPGGKTGHMLERAAVDVLALDRDRARTARIQSNLQRLGLHASVRAADAAEPAAWWDGRPFDRILLDAPCSATGVIRRHPDIKLHRRASDIPQLVAGQRRLLRALWPTLAPGGRLVYATCSLLRAENDGAVASLIEDHPDAEPRAVALPAGQSAGAGWQILPGDAGLDGMFYAVLAKRTA